MADRTAETGASRATAPRHDWFKIGGIQLGSFELGTAALALFFIWLQSTRLFVDVGDDGFHYYAARLVSAGLVPHRDFFYGTAPGPALLIGSMLALGLPVAATKLVPVIATVVAGVSAGLIARLRAPDWAALVAVLLVLCSSLALRLGAYQGGHWVGSSLVAIAVWSGLRSRWRVAGVLWSFALMYDMHASIGAIALVGLALRDGGLSPRGGLSRLIQGLAVLAVGLAALWLWCGTGLFDQTVSYALMPAPGTRNAIPAAQLWRLLRLESALIALALASALDKDGFGRALAVVAFITTLTILLPLSRTSALVIPVIMLGAAGGVGAGNLVQTMAANNKRKWLGPAIVTVFLIATTVPHVISGLARRRGKAIANQRIAALVDMVKSRPPKSGRIWGDSAVVPTLAFRSGLAIPAHDFDTNDRRVRTGLTAPGKLLTRAVSEGPPAFVLVRGHGIGLIREVRFFAWRAMRFDFIFRGGVGYRPLYFLAQPDFDRYQRLKESELFDVPAPRRTKRRRSPSAKP